MLENTNFEMIRYTLDNMGDAVCVTNRRGELSYLNPAAETLLGISLIPGKVTKIWEAIPYVETNDDLIQLFIQAIQSRENARQMLVKYQNTEGRISQVRVSLTYKKEEGLFLIIISDLTELFRVTNAFVRYTSPQIADYVLHAPGGDSQGGKSKELSILFADLRGFTALSSSLPPEQFVSMINRFFEKQVQVVYRFRGTVIEFLGDCIFAIFGAPTDDPDHAPHALACAIEMQNAMDEINQMNRADGWPDLSLGIGINSGTAIVGNIGSRDKMKYGCIGETVNLASRVEVLTVGGEILISENTAKLISEPLDIADEREFMPKGGRRPMKALLITGMGSEYRLKNQPHEMSWNTLKKEKEITFHFLDEHKSVTDAVYSGVFTAVAPDGSYAMLSSATDLASSADIMIDIGGSLYAKVTGHENGAAIVCFTSKPGCFDSWLSSLSGL